jgi:single-stranded-DNA-specific exonuclease
VAPVDTLHPLLARVYSGRGIATPEELNLALDQLLPPAGLLRVDGAARLLADALAADPPVRPWQSLR